MLAHLDAKTRDTTHRYLPLQCIRLHPAGVCRRVARTEARTSLRNDPRKWPQCPWWSGPLCRHRPAVAIRWAILIFCRTRWICRAHDRASDRLRGPGVHFGHAIKALRRLVRPGRAFDGDWRGCVGEPAWGGIRVRIRSCLMAQRHSIIIHSTVQHFAQVVGIFVLLHNLLLAMTAGCLLITGGLSSLSLPLM